MEILVGVLIFVFGLFVGFLLKIVLGRMTNYSGTILVTHHVGKTYYSLVLDDYPEKLEFRKQVVFKVEAPESSEVRN